MEEMDFVKAASEKCTWINLQDMLKEVQENLHGVQMEWEKVKVMTSSAIVPQILAQDDIIVSKTSCHRLVAEVNQVKTLLPHVQQSHQLATSTTSRLTGLEAELDQSQQDNGTLRAEMIHWKNQAHSAITQAQKEAKEHLELRVEVQDLTSQLSQQSEFCSSLGAACGTLLWRLSRQEESVQNIVSGARSVEFLQLTATSVQSYLTAYKDDQWPEQSTDEASFILALCGTITNIAASALGREYLTTSPQGQSVMDTFISFIGEAPMGKSSNMKSLMLMSLYNISINQKGLKYLCSKSGLVALLCWHLTEEKDADNRVNTLRLLQSLISDETSARLVPELRENLPMVLLQQLTASSNKDIQDLSLDIVMDMRRLDSEQ